MAGKRLALIVATDEYLDPREWGKYAFTLAILVIVYPLFWSFTDWRAIYSGQENVVLSAVVVARLALIASIIPRLKRPA